MTTAGAVAGLAAVGQLMACAGGSEEEIAGDVVIKLDSVHDTVAMKTLVGDGSVAVSYLGGDGAETVRIIGPGFWDDAFGDYVLSEISWDLTEALDDSLQAVHYDEYGMDGLQLLSVYPEGSYDVCRSALACALHYANLKDSALPRDDNYEHLALLETPAAEDLFEPGDHDVSGEWVIGGVTAQELDRYNWTITSSYEVLVEEYYDYDVSLYDPIEEHVEIRGGLLTFCSQSLGCDSMIGIGGGLSYVGQDIDGNLFVTLDGVLHFIPEAKVSQYVAEYPAVLKNDASKVATRKGDPIAAYRARLIGDVNQDDYSDIALTFSTAASHFDDRDEIQILSGKSFGQDNDPEVLATVKTYEGQHALEASGAASGLSFDLLVTNTNETAYLIYGPLDSTYKIKDGEVKGATYKKFTAPDNKRIVSAKLYSQGLDGRSDPVVAFVLATTTSNTTDLSNYLHIVKL